MDLSDDGSLHRDRAAVHSPLDDASAEDSSRRTLSNMDGAAIAKLLGQQSGVITRRQVLARGGGDTDIARLVRRREWARVHEGVFVDHTGPPSWEQHAWAAVLYAAPAALTGRSALRAHRLWTAGDVSAPIEVAIAEDRRVRPPAGVRIDRLVAFDGVAQLHRSPPVVRLEHALLSVAGRGRSEDEAVAVIADAVQSGRTTPARLAALLTELPRLRHRRLLLVVLDDVAAGAYSALERRYLRTVERPHGLPTGHRQRRVSRGRAVHFRDVDYVGLDTLVELDGRLGHEQTTDRWRDLERDVGNAVAGQLTVRAGWALVLDPCRLAAAVDQILRARGWADAARACGPKCLMG